MSDLHRSTVNRSTVNRSAINKSATSRMLLPAGLLMMLLVCSAHTFADPGSADSASADSAAVVLSSSVEEAAIEGYTTTYQPNWLTLPSDIAASAEGFDKHRLSDGRKLVGWKLSDTLYFGRAKKEGATVSLVWEKTPAQRVSLSTDGLRFTRRFQ